MDIEKKNDYVLQLKAKDAEVRSYGVPVLRDTVRSRAFNNVNVNLINANDAAAHVMPTCVISNIRLNCMHF